MKILIRLIVNAIAIYTTTLLLPGFNLSGGIWALLVVAIIFGLVNTFIRPIIKLLTLPLTIITLGLFTLVVNTLMLLLTVWISGALSIAGGFFKSFFIAFIAAVIISIISAVLSWFLPDKD